MAAYAAVASLMNTIDDILNHPLHSFSLDKEEFESLHMIVGLLLDFVESYNPGGGGEEEEGLESLIASEANAAENAIDSHVAHQILSRSKGDHGQTSSSSWLQVVRQILLGSNGYDRLSILTSLHRVIQDMNAVKEKVVVFKERKELEYVQPSNSSKPLSLGFATNDMVGFQDELDQLKDGLIGHQSDLQIVPIVGMGGIGKTTLAANVYKSSLVSECFDVRAWVTISQNYSLNKILSELGSCIVNKETDLESEDRDLGLKLYQSLYGRRYLIVLDDMWSIQVWDMIKSIFPDNGNRSRVVITSRISNIAAHLTSSSLEMKLLDEDNCWKLFYREVFLGDVCPLELEEIGMNIVGECKGLPLSIMVVGGPLRSSPRTVEHWENLARDIKSCLMSRNGNCLDILSLSYYHLPAHLKPCFLHMGVFREDEKILFSYLIRYLVGEGLVRPKDGKSLEEIAEDYIKELVHKNLISVGGWRWSGRIKYLKMHDVVREVCLRIAKKDKFFYAVKVIKFEREFVYYNLLPRVFDSLPDPSASLACKFRSMGGLLPFKSRFMRALNQLNFNTLETDLQQVHLRRLVFMPSSLNPEEFPSELPSSLCLLGNLQTLIITGFTRIRAPPEVWHMRQLRHLKINDLLLPDPPPTQDEGDARVLPNLQKLSRVVNFSFTEEVCKRLPNMKKLVMMYSEECQKLYCHLNHLHKLQSLNCSFHQNLERGDLLEGLVFPTSLRKLSLGNSSLDWADVNKVGRMLPHLEDLRLGKGAVLGPEWDSEEGAFPSLKFLLIGSGDLVKWTAESFDVFPVLEKLGLRLLKKLEKIPSGMGEMHTLQFLYVHCCSKSAAISSTEILLQQLEFGYQDLKVLLHVESKDAEKSLRTKALSEGLTHLNFEVRNYYDYATSLGKMGITLIDS